MHIASKRGYKNICQYLLDVGAEKAAVNQKARTAERVAKTFDLGEFIRTYEPVDTSSKKSLEGGEEEIEGEIAGMLQKKLKEMERKVLGLEERLEKSEEEKSKLELRVEELERLVLVEIKEKMDKIKQIL